MTETAIEIIRLFLTILPFLAASYCIWQSFSARAKEYPHIHVIWLLRAIIWQMAIILAIIADGGVVAI